MKPVAKIVGVDEYGPIIEWTTHWVDLKGAELCVVEQAARATPADHISQARDAVIEELRNALVLMMDVGFQHLPANERARRYDIADEALLALKSAPPEKPAGDVSDI